MPHLTGCAKLLYTTIMTAGCNRTAPKVRRDNGSLDANTHQAFAVHSRRESAKHSRRPHGTVRDAKHGQSGSQKSLNYRCRLMECAWQGTIRSTQVLGKHTAPHACKRSTQCQQQQPSPGGTKREAAWTHQSPADRTRARASWGDATHSSSKQHTSTAHAV